MLCKIMAANNMTANFNNYVIFVIFIVVYLISFILDSDLEKSAFHKSS